MRASLLEFLSNFSDRFFFWVGLVLLMVDLAGKNIPRIKKRLEEIPHYVFLGFSALCLFIASFQVWNEQKERAEKAESKLEELSKPILSSQLEEFAIAPNGSSGQDSVITLNLHIRNQGALTGIENFNIRVSRGGKTYKTLLLRPVNAFLLAGSNRSEPPIVRLTVESNLMHVASQPIERNSAKDTWVQVYVYGLSKADFFAQDGAQATFVYHDIATRTSHEDLFNLSRNANQQPVPRDIEKQSRLHAVPSR